MGELTGTWDVHLNGFTGILTVSITQTGNRIEGTVLGGSSSLTNYIPAGKLMFYGTYAADSFRAQEICAGLNYSNPHWTSATFQVIDSNHLQETYPYIFAGGCGGSPALWERELQSVSVESSPSGSAGCTSTPAPQGFAAPSVAVNIPAGTEIPIRTIDSIDSSKNQVGQQFAASVDAPVIVGDHVAIPKDAYAWVQLVQAQSAGHIAGRSELQVELVSVKSEGICYDAVSSTYKIQGASRGKQSAKRIGGLAALGAIIGGVTHGAKGAIAGAGAGAAAGTAVQVLTHGPQVRVPSETLIDFTLQSPVTVMLKP